MLDSLPMRARTLGKAGASLIGLGLAVVLSAQTPDWKPHPGANFPLVGGNWWNQRHSTLVDQQSGGHKLN